MIICSTHFTWFTMLLGKKCKSSFHVPIPSISQDLVVDTTGIVHFSMKNSQQSVPSPFKEWNKSNRFLSTGAGDAFVGSFAHYISKLPIEQRDDHDAIREIIQKACAVATYSVQKNGTQASFPYLSDILPSSIHALSLWNSHQLGKLTTQIISFTPSFVQWLTTYVEWH